MNYFSSFLFLFSKKPKKSPWKVPDADQKKLFNDVSKPSNFSIYYRKLFYLV